MGHTRKDKAPRFKQQTAPTPEQEACSHPLAASEELPAVWDDVFLDVIRHVAPQRGASGPATDADGLVGGSSTDGAGLSSDWQLVGLSWTRAPRRAARGGRNRAYEPFAAVVFESAALAAIARHKRPADGAMPVRHASCLANGQRAVRAASMGPPTPRIAGRCGRQPVSTGGRGWRPGSVISSNRSVARPRSLESVGSISVRQTPSAFVLSLGALAPVLIACGTRVAREPHWGSR
jgi:hypothetical protein